MAAKVQRFCRLGEWLFEYKIYFDIARFGAVHFD